MIITVAAPRKLPARVCGIVCLPSLIRDQAIIGTISVSGITFSPYRATVRKASPAAEVQWPLIFHLSVIMKTKRIWRSAAAVTISINFGAPARYITINTVVAYANIVKSGHARSSLMFKWKSLTMPLCTSVRTNMVGGMIRSEINTRIQKVEESLLAASAVTTMQDSATSGGLKRLEISLADLSRQSDGIMMGSVVSW